MAIAFYCLGTLDVTGIAERQISPTSRKSWKEWIWDQYAGKEHIVFFLFYCAHFLLTWCFGCAITEGGFHPGPFVSVSGGDTTAHVRPIPSLLHLPPVRAFAHLGFNFPDHHDDHIYISSYPSPTYMDTLTPFQTTQTSHLQNSSFICGKVSQHKEEQGQEWWRPRLI